MAFDLSTASPVSGETKKVGDPYSDIPTPENLEASRLLSAERNQQRPQFSAGEKLLGVGEAGLTTALGAVTSPFSALLGAGGFVKSLSGELLSGSDLKNKDVQGRIRQSTESAMALPLYQPRTQAGQQYLGNVAEFSQNLAPIAGLQGEMLALTNAANAARPVGLKNAFSTGAKLPKEGLDDTLINAQKAVASRSGKKMIEAKPDASKLGVAAESLKNDPFNADNAAFRLIGDKAIPDDLSATALKQGFRPGFISTVKTLSPSDLRKGMDMLKTLKIGKNNDRFRAMNRPSDEIGASIDRRVKFLFQEKKSAGRDIDRVANNLKGKSVNYNPALESFFSDLRDVGITLERTKKGIKANLLGSDVEGNQPSARLLNRVLDRLYNTNKPDAYGVHRAKRFIDTQVEFGKVDKNALSESTIRVVKNLRRNLNETLKEYSQPYREANKKFSDITGALDNFQDAVGKKTNLDSPNAVKSLGTSARKVLTNYGSRTNLIDSLDEIDSVTSRYGLSSSDDIISQITMANELDRMFGNAAPGSFEGILQRAGKTGIERASEASRSSIAENALKLAGEGIKKIRGVNEGSAINALNDLLKREYRLKQAARK